MKHLRQLSVQCGKCRLNVRYRVSTGPEFYDTKLLDEWASKEPTIMTIPSAISYGRNAPPNKMIHSAEFVRKEMLIRFALSLRRFQNLPHIIMINPHFTQVTNLYWESFNSLREVAPIRTAQDDINFTKYLTGQTGRYSEVLRHLSEGMKEIRALPANFDIDFDYVDSFLNTFLHQRLSRTVIKEYHVGLHEEKEGWVSIFNTNTKIADVVASAIQATTEMTEDMFGVAPKAGIVGDIDTAITYIPGHIQYVLIELFKNAMKATVLKHQSTGKGVIPELVVRICYGHPMLTIIILDQGGGIPASEVKNIWSYGYTTVNKEEHKCEKEPLFDAYTSPSHRTTSSMAGYGFGLPICRVYAHYFGGTLELQTVENYGTAAYLKLVNLDASEARECLEL